MTHHSVESLREMAQPAIRQATSDVFTTMLGCSVELGETELKNHPKLGGTSLMSIVGIAGPFYGTGVISCDALTACRIAGALLMDSYEHVNDEVLDAMGEMGNMVVGNVKTILEGQLGALSLSTPTVVYGRDLVAHVSNGHKWLCTRFKSDLGEVEIQMFLAVAEQGQGHPHNSGLSLLGGRF